MKSLHQYVCVGLSCICEEVAESHDREGSEKTPHKMRECKAKLNERDFCVIIFQEFKFSRCVLQDTSSINNSWRMVTASERTRFLQFQKFASGDLGLQYRQGRGRKPSLNNKELRATIEIRPETNTRAFEAKPCVAHVKIKTFSINQKI